MVRPSKTPPANKNASQQKNNISVRKPRKSVAPKIRSTTRETKALKEMKYYMRTWNSLIPRLPFQRMVRQALRDVTGDFSDDEYKIQREALEALQEAAEMYLVQLFEDTVLTSIHAKRVTIRLDDMYLVRRLRGRGDVCGHRVVWD